LFFVEIERERGKKKCLLVMREARQCERGERHGEGEAASPTRKGKNPRKKKEAKNEML
jgi:hypothetical protein